MDMKYATRLFEDLESGRIIIAVFIKATCGHELFLCVFECVKHVVSEVVVRHGRGLGCSTDRGQWLGSGTGNIFSTAVTSCTLFSIYGEGEMGIKNEIFLQYNSLQCLR